VLNCGLAAVLAPRRVARVGAPDQLGSVGRLLWDNLADFPGEALPVCQVATLGGRLAYHDLRDVSGEVDLAVIATPAATMPDIVRAATGKGVAAVVVLSAGFAETGPARRRPLRGPGVRLGRPQLL
jgi:acetyltransferase